MLAVNGHAKHRQSLCRVGYGKTALSMGLFFITTANILSNHTFLLLSQLLPRSSRTAHPKKNEKGDTYVSPSYCLYNILLSSCLSYNLERNLYRNLLVKFDCSAVRTDLLCCVSNNNLAVNLKTKLCKLLCNLSRTD